MNTLKWVAIAKGPETDSPYLKFGVDRARVHLVVLVTSLLPKIQDMKKRNELESDLKNLRMKLAEGESIFKANQRQRNKIRTCRNRLAADPK